MAANVPATLMPAAQVPATVVCVAAEIELGRFDHAILVWLAGWEPSTVAAVAGLIARARPRGARAALLGEPGVAQPGGGWISGPSS